MKFILTIALLLVITFSYSQVQVMSYNIKYDDRNDPVNGWKARKVALIGLIDYHNPDIIGTQEALKHQLDDITTSLEKYSYLGVARDDGDTTGEYSAILYDKNKYRVLDQGTFWLSETPSKPSKAWDAALPRICTWAFFEDKEGFNFYIFNTHFDHVGNQAREKSAELISSKMTELDHPAILTGDFNVTSATRAYTELTSVLADAKKESYKRPYGPDATFNGFQFNEKPERRIDYIFFAGQWKVLDYVTMSDSQDMKYPSDHFPVMATFVYETD